MVHPGLPWAWALPVLLAMAAIALWALWAPPPAGGPARRVTLARLPLIGPAQRRLSSDPTLLTALRIVVAAAFLGLIYAGFAGSPVPGANIATVATWTVWWTLVIVSVLVVGTSWCAVCPWNTLAGWLVRRRLWGIGDSASSLGLKVPRVLRSSWPALVMLCGLTWLELGVGVTQSPGDTATLAVIMVLLATLSLALFERSAFCRHLCPVGRTIGCYAQLSPVELRPIDQNRCDRCTTLECYRGTAAVEPCPAALTMGRMAQSTYCLSCGACALSCPDGNVSWHLRPMAHEASTGARPHRDEAWFMLGLLGLASFHGLTMLPLWDDAIGTLGRALGDSTRLLASFSVGMAMGLALPMALYAAAVAATRPLLADRQPYGRLFANLAFATLPLAFTYHMAHNLTHLLREGVNLPYVLADPLGLGPPPDALERHIRLLDSLVPDPLLFTVQAGLMLAGFWLSVQILRRRAQAAAGWRLSPMLLFLAAVAGGNTWLLTHDMIMRM